MIFIGIFTGLFLVLWALFILLTPVLMHGLTAAAKRTARFRYHDYLPVFLMLAAAIVITAVAGDAFLDLAEMVHGSSPVLQKFDADVHRWAAAERSSGATRFFLVVTNVGGPAGMGLVVLIVAAVLVIRRRFRWLGYLLVTTGIGALLNVQLKAYFARARPDLAEAIRRAHGYSFPSGHAMGSMVVCGALAYLGYRTLPTIRTKAAAIAGALTFVVAVAVSRVYIGVHWTSDVGAGMSAGLLWVIGTTVSYETFRRIRLVRALRKQRVESSRA